MSKTSWVFSISAHSTTMHDLQMQNWGSQTNLNDNLLETDTHVSGSSQVNVQMASMVLSSSVCSNELTNVVPPYFQSSDRQRQFLIQIFINKLTDTDCIWTTMWFNWRTLCIGPVWWQSKVIRGIQVIWYIVDFSVRDFNNHFFLATMPIVLWQTAQRYWILCVPLLQVFGRWSNQLFHATSQDGEVTTLKSHYLVCDALTRINTSWTERLSPRESCMGFLWSLVLLSGGRQFPFHKLFSTLEVSTQLLCHVC